VFHRVENLGTSASWREPIPLQHQPRFRDGAARLTRIPPIFPFSRRALTEAVKPALFTAIRGMSSPDHPLDQLRLDRSASTRPRPRRKRWLIVLICLAVVFLAAAHRMSKNRAVDVRTLVVREVAGDQRSVLNASGYVTARRAATVSSKVTGKVIEVLIEEGQRVPAGQILARLDASNVQASLNLAQAQLEAAEASLVETRVRLEQAEKESRRIAALASAQIAAEAEKDNAEAELNSLRARLARQEKDVAVARSECAVWKQQLEDTIIRAPFAGVVTVKNAQPGEMISPISAGGGFTRTGIGTLVDMDSLEIEVDVNESFLNRVQPGQAVEAALDAYPDVKMPCKVIAIIPAADRQKATVKVRVGFDKTDARTLPDMGAKVSFRAPAENRASHGFTVPAKAVHRQGAETTVTVIVQGLAEIRPVQADPAQGEEALVTSGLQAGDHVVVDGPADLKPGQRVVENRR